MSTYKTLEVKLDTELSMQHFKIDKPRKNFVNANIKKITEKHPLNSDLKPLAIHQPSKMRNEMRNI